MHRGDRGEVAGAKRGVAHHARRLERGQQHAHLRRCGALLLLLLRLSEDVALDLQRARVELEDGAGAEDAPQLDQLLVEAAQQRGTAWRGGVAHQLPHRAAHRPRPRLCLRCVVSRRRLGAHMHVAVAAQMQHRAAEVRRLRHGARPHQHALAQCLVVGVAPLDRRPRRTSHGRVRRVRRDGAPAAVEAEPAAEPRRELRVAEALVQLVGVERHTTARDERRVVVARPPLVARGGRSGGQPGGQHVHAAAVAAVTAVAACGRRGDRDGVGGGRGRRRRRQQRAEEAQEVAQPVQHAVVGRRAAERVGVRKVDQPQLRRHAALGLEDEQQRRRDEAPVRRGGEHDEQLLEAARKLAHR